jgi:hypothetical protein
MSAYPLMLYKAAEPFADWAAVGEALRASRLTTVIADDETEEAVLRAEGYGDVGSIMAKPKPAKKAKE